MFWKTRKASLDAISVHTFHTQKRMIWIISNQIHRHSKLYFQHGTWSGPQQGRRQRIQLRLFCVTSWGAIFYQNLRAQRPEGSGQWVNECPELDGYFGDWGTCPVQLLQSGGGVSYRSQKSRNKQRFYRDNSHTIQFTPWRCKRQCLLVFSHIQSYVTIIIKFRIFFTHKNKYPLFISNYSLLPHNPFLSHPPISPPSPVLCCVSAHGILQARMVEWVAMPSSMESSQPRDQTQVSQIIGRFFTVWATRKTQEYWSG